jgi:hypothetical protein
MQMDPRRQETGLPGRRHLFEFSAMFSKNRAVSMQRGAVCANPPTIFSLPHPLLWGTIILTSKPTQSPITMKTHLPSIGLSLFTGLLLLSASSSLAQETANGFVSLFNGNNLEGWDGDSRFWRVENGAIVGETTTENKAEKNTFLIYRGDTFDDFVLRFSYQVSGYNSGVQYRSVDLGNYVVKGYQADFEARWHKKDNGDKFDQYSGMFFEENGRMFLAQRGEAVIVKPDPDDSQKHVIEKIGSVGDTAEIEQAIHRDDWNEYTVIANGNQFTHLINGRVTAVAIDEHDAKRRKSGLIAFQLHSGPPMKIQVKDIRVRPMK